MSAVGPTIDVWCPQCGPEPGETCTYVYGNGTPEEMPGAERPDLHFYRTRPPERYAGDGGGTATRRAAEARRRGES